MAHRRLVLGDIHGELDAMLQVFASAEFDYEQDTLIQVGDICDRGPCSFEVVEELKKCKKLVLIEGNHDQLFKRYIESNMSKMDDLWIQQGGLTTIESYMKNKVSPRVHESFYGQQVPYFIDENNNCFVHGGFNRSQKIAHQDADSLSWNRELVNEMMRSLPGVKLPTADNFHHIYIGHTPTVYWGRTNPITRGGITNIDTGAGKGGKLTLMDIASGKYWQSDLIKNGQ